MTTKNEECVIREMTRKKREKKRERREIERREREKDLCEIMRNDICNNWFFQTTSQFSTINA